MKRVGRGKQFRDTKTPAHNICSRNQPSRLGHIEPDMVWCWAVQSTCHVSFPRHCRTAMSRHIASENVFMKSSLRFWQGEEVNGFEKEVHSITPKLAAQLRWSASRPHKDGSVEPKDTAKFSEQSIRAEVRAEKNVRIGPDSGPPRGAHMWVDQQRVVQCACCQRPPRASPAISVAGHAHRVPHDWLGRACTARSARWWRSQ